MSWGASSLQKYNGVDVDSIFNSKRHKKTGKLFSSAELRNWIVKYITKYVTKNTEKFKHLCWHCSRSVSILFTSSIVDFKNVSDLSTYLPSIANDMTRKNNGFPSLYEYFKSDFADIFVFKFVPNPIIFTKINTYNDWIFVEHEPQNEKIKSQITYKTTTL